MEYKLKKSLGQHFLKDENICQKIFEAVTQLNANQLLEVGPGAGALTKYLITLTHTQFKAIELDDEKVQYLLHHYPVLQHKLIHQDFLQATPPFENEFAVVGNFPYNISSQIMFKLLQWKQQVPFCIGMFQKEVAQRLAAAPGSKTYGILSVLIGAYYHINYLFDVPPGCFNPPPKVMSGVIKLVRKEVVPDMASEKKFTLLVKTAFNQRRKTLRNAVRGLFSPSVLAEDIFNKRAEQLSIEDFASLTFKMN